MELVGEEKARHLLNAGLGVSEDERVRLKLENRRLEAENAELRVKLAG